ncbi:MAG: hypothetical protein HQM12_17055 [SAR324 cluster bacterium]|nr:hypothetical protein [SAR324 cluster bacterium]MBF0352249.1 hypothetical protein [SAR324 cluster bacterium]
MKIDEIQAYGIMEIFLRKYYERTKSDDIAMILSDMQIMLDGESADPATLIEWQECVSLFFERNRKAS